MSIRDEIVSEARSWLGTPYHHLGAIKGDGVDCAMLLVETYKSVGLIPYNIDPRPYAPEWHLHRDAEAFLGWLTDFADETALPLAGDVVVWQFGRAFSHGGIVVGDSGEIVHAYKDAGIVTLGNLNESQLMYQKNGKLRPCLFFKLRGID